mmetsp:Transcript_10077/g.24011  ORF Transcript_10077/g.24011 Transcript_10077/m.24011 type:complete len:322 (+) Transcript_10077:561-1526(+)
MLQAHGPRLEGHAARGLGVLHAVAADVGLAELVLAEVADLKHEVALAVNLADDRLLGETHRGRSHLAPGDARVDHRDDHRVQQGLPERGRAQHEDAGVAPMEGRVRHAVSYGLDGLDGKVEGPDEGPSLQAALPRHHAEEAREDQPARDQRGRRDDHDLGRAHVHQRVEEVRPLQRHYGARVVDSPHAQAAVALPEAGRAVEKPWRGALAVARAVGLLFKPGEREVKLVRHEFHAILGDIGLPDARQPVIVQGRVMPRARLWERKRRVLAPGPAPEAGEGARRGDEGPLQLCAPCVPDVVRHGPSPRAPRAAVELAKPEAA